MKSEKSRSNGIAVLGKLEDPGLRMDGGKAFYLDMLAKNGVRVPEGLVVRTTVFKRFLRENEKVERLASFLENQLSTKVETKLVKEIFSTAAFPKLPESELRSMMGELNLNDKRFVVRSSATMEDGAKSSFAGQFSTKINVSLTDLNAAMIEIYSSLFMPGVIGYMRRNNVKVSDLGMALVVQRFIETEFAGVVFTIDPVSNNRERMLIESVRGIGEDLVSGKKQPDTISLNRKNEVDIISQTRPEESPSQDTIKQIARKALEVETLLGCGADVEWGIRDGIYILQGRPITTLK